ncbi:MAG TPA: 50S ribosomal protein L13 [Abditibacteriaceae bacterium]|jgi:large subunit ribosomal protein L13
MASIKGKSYHAKPGEVERLWHVVDASGQTLGRLASRVALILRGKHRPQFTPSTDTGDCVIIINADKVKLTGNKLQDKIYYRVTTRPGSMKRVDAETMLEAHPERILENAIHRMLPRTTQGRQQRTRLHVYAGDKHPHEAQRPQPLEIKL